MATTKHPTDQLLAALASPSPDVRLHAAMAIGTTPDAARLPRLLERCAVEPDFYVREMLTWAIIQLPRELTVPAAPALTHGRGRRRRVAQSRAVSPSSPAARPVHRRDG
ncbi:HEAT repeat domain-containing protein [Luteococcus sp. H138]|uniref:HEAT repeat domain-containing protein n=1 Tax=unclassified Luteococcus TaxID=2639923 RepID=UPI00313AF444